MELYGRVRRAVLVDGVSQRAAAREFGISRKSVRKMVSFSVPPGYRREQPAKRPKLDAWVGVIDAILEEDKTRPAKQRHTAKRVWDRLRICPETGEGIREVIGVGRFCCIGWSHVPERFDRCAVEEAGAVAERAADWTTCWRAASEV